MKKHGVGSWISALFAVAAFFVAARVQAQTYSADFSQAFSGSDYGADFEKVFTPGCDGTNYFGCDSVIDSGALRVTRNAVFRTKRGDIAPTPEAPLTIDADMNWSGVPTLAFITWRDPDGAVASLNGEPQAGYGLRLHPIGNNGLTHGSANDNTSFPYSGTYSSTVPANFYDARPIHVHVVDDGTTATVTLTNASSVSFDFTITGVNNTLFDDGHVVFSGDTRVNASDVVSWDNIVIQVGSAPPAVAASIPTLSEWGMIVMFALLAGSMLYTQRKKQPAAR